MKKNKWVAVDLEAVSIDVSTVEIVHDLMKNEDDARENSERIEMNVVMEAEEDQEIERAAGRIEAAVESAVANAVIEKTPRELLVQGGMLFPIF